MKAVYDRVIGKPKIGQQRYLSYIQGRKNIPLKSFKNKRLKFRKSICGNCNAARTQPYDDAFLSFVNRLIKSKSSIVSRGKIPIWNDIEWQNVALYCLKILGCLVVECGARFTDRDQKLIRLSLTSGRTMTKNVFLSMHRDIGKLSVKNSKTIASHPQFAKDWILWTIDLDWISLILSYPYHPPEHKYGTAWNLGQPFPSIRLGKLT